jgi:hypothetical protein
MEMKENGHGYPLSKDEVVLLRYFRDLSAQQQLALLDAAESSCNAAARMQVLASRRVERLPPSEQQDLH